MSWFTNHTGPENLRIAAVNLIDLTTFLGLRHEMTVWFSDGVNAAHARRSYDDLLKAAEFTLTDEDRLMRDAYILGAQVSPGEVETVRGAWSEVVR